MSPRRRRTAVLDAEPGEAPSIEEAEAAALTAETRAEMARVRVEELRRQAAKASRSERLSRLWSRRRAISKYVAVGVAVLLILASVGATVAMVLHHRSVLADEQRSAEFAAAARQGVVTMLTIDPATIKQDVQRMVDNSTGDFKRALQSGAAQAMIQGAQQAKVKTGVTVQSVAVESMDGDSAVVLVAATSDGSGQDNVKLPTQTWRLSVTLTRQDGQLKMSKFEFV